MLYHYVPSLTYVSPQVLFCLRFQAVLISHSIKTYESLQLPISHNCNCIHLFSLVNILWFPVRIILHVLRCWSLRVRNTTYTSPGVFAERYNTFFTHLSKKGKKKGVFKFLTLQLVVLGSKKCFYLAVSSRNYYFLYLRQTHVSVRHSSRLC